MRDARREPGLREALANRTRHDSDLNLLFGLDVAHDRLQVLLALLKRVIVSTRFLLRQAPLLPDERFLDADGAHQRSDRNIERAPVLGVHSCVELTGEPASELE